MAMVKRGVDVAIALAGVIITLPLLALGSLWVLLDDGSPAFFHQKRVGRLGREFTIFKLRTLKIHEFSPDELGQVRETTPLLTSSGRWLRRLRVDELPQLVNVLKGDMSLVGPRPTLRSQAEEYDDYQRRRLEMRPGLTGWAQVNGNTRLSWDERILLDVWYVDHWSLGLDLRILVSTAEVFINGERVNRPVLEEAMRHANGAGWSR